MKMRLIVCSLFITLFLSGPWAESRVGGGRTFGSRGARGFSMPSRSYQPSQIRPQGNPMGGYSAPHQSQQQQPNPYYRNSMDPPRPSFMRSLGAGIAGGFLGSLLFRSLGGGHSGMAYGGSGGGFGGSGIGLIEILLVGGVLLLLFKLFSQRSQPSSVSSTGFGHSTDPSASHSEGAAALMREARPMGWNNDRSTFSVQNTSTPIDRETAMDLFFQIQAAWGSRELQSVQSLIDSDAKLFLNQEISRLKSLGQINRLENIAIRSSEVVESWNEGNRDYSTVHFIANLLDYTVNEATQQVVEGSKVSPVKFEEFWTFSRETGTAQWQFSAIQQS